MFELTDEDAEELVKRFITETEDIEMLASDEEWQEFLSSKLLTERGYLPSEAQIERLSAGARLARVDVGFTVERIFPERPWETIYRDIPTGRFISRPEALYKLTTWRR